MFLLDIFNLGKSFQHYYGLVPALSAPLRDEVFRLRHQVYCVDLGFEAVRPDLRETDAYDGQSLHLLIRSVQIDRFIGCARLIRTCPDDPEQPLPFENACRTTLNRSIVDPSRLPRESIAEMSRFAVISRFRKRKGEAQTPMGVYDKYYGSWSQPRFPYISAGLFLGMVELARLNDIDTVFFLSEPREVISLARLGVKCQVIGTPIEHRGERIPSMVQVGDVFKGLNFLVRRLYHTTAAEVGSGLGFGN